MQKGKSSPARFLVRCRICGTEYFAKVPMASLCSKQCRLVAGRESKVKQRQNNPEAAREYCRKARQKSIEKDADKYYSRQHESYKRCKEKNPEKWNEDQRRRDHKHREKDPDGYYLKKREYRLLNRDMLNEYHRTRCRKRSALIAALKELGINTGDIEC